MPADRCPGCGVRMEQPAGHYCLSCTGFGTLIVLWAALFVLMMGSLLLKS